MNKLEELKKNVSRLYDEYVDSTREAFESERHFNLSMPRTPELGAKCKKAFQDLDAARKLLFAAEKENK